MDILHRVMIIIPLAIVLVLFISFLGASVLLAIQDLYDALSSQRSDGRSARNIISKVAIRNVLLAKMD